jgi:hypothetical protein
MDLGEWLRSLGLERYEPAFRENDIDDAILPRLTAEDLKELGVSSLGTATSSSMLLLLCTPTGAERGPLRPLRPRRLLHAPIPKNALSAAK